MTQRGQHLDHLSIEDLCKPVSAREMPRRILVGTFCDAEVTTAMAIKAQRQDAAMAAKRIARLRGRA